MENNQFYILLLSSTVTTVIVLLNYFQQKKIKQNQEQKTDYLKCTSLSDFEQLAKKSMMTHRYIYYNYKTGHGHTYQACRDYFDKQLRIMPRVLINVSEISLKTTVFGYTYELPIMIAPTGFHCLAHVDGEVATARAATEAQCCYSYNWLYSTKPEMEVLQTTGPKFLSIYLSLPMEVLTDIVEKAEENGYRAIVITCDDPTDRLGYYIKPMFRNQPKHVDPELGNIVARAKSSIYNKVIEEHSMKSSVSWAILESVRKLTKLPIICKGILSPNDAELAIKYGANGIIVSNHGGRQIDTAVPAIECLEDIVNVVDGRIEVFVDTGIRSGTDVLKALALGARAVFIGRPILYGLACGGQDGVKRVLDLLKRELTDDMACCGLTSIDQINKDILYKHKSVIQKY